MKLLEDGGVNVEQLKNEVEAFLDKQPKVSGDTSSQKSLGKTLADVFEAGRGVRDGLKVSAVVVYIIMQFAINFAFRVGVHI